MEIYVRNSDGLVLNSYEFNTSSNTLRFDNKVMYAEEDHTVYDIPDIPDAPDREWHYKFYYYENGTIAPRYVPEVHLINQEIIWLKAELSGTDYKVIKSYEAVLIDQPAEYDMGEVHAERQALRDRINELENYLTTE